MTSQIRVQFQTHGSFLYDQVPLQVKIADENLNTIETRWSHSDKAQIFPLDPGIYVVSATAPSSDYVQRVIKLDSNQTMDCLLPVYRISKHESHEWAHLTNKLRAPGIELFEHNMLNDAWIRLWHRDGGLFQVELDVNNKLHPVDQNEDGVIYEISNLSREAWCLQVGGPKVSWKCVAIPPTMNAKVLVQPSTTPGAHPLNLVVSSGNIALDGLLALLQRGEIQEAIELERQPELAERFLFEKYSNPASAAIGGYYLLRINDLPRLHGWPNNLARDFQWMVDGAIIHAWQIIAEYRKENRDSGTLDDARSRLLQAVERGFPIYTEGLRLLRDGLFLFDNLAKGRDKAVRSALQRVGGYIAAVDWTAPTLTFVGETPNTPSLKVKNGIPKSTKGLKYLWPKYKLPVKLQFRLEYIEGISPVYAAKLNAIGVTNLLDLLEKGAFPKGRAEIAKATGIRLALVLKWVNHIDLLRIKGVGSEYADLLETAGVDTVVELANRNPVNLFNKMLSVNQEKKLVRKTPVEKQVKVWVEQAKSLPRKVTY